MVVPSKHPILSWGRAKCHLPNTELNKFLSTVVCLYTQPNSALNTGYTFWSCYCLIKNHGTFCLLKTRTFFPRYFCLIVVLYAFNPWVSYLSILLWIRSEGFEGSLAVPVPAVLWFMSCLRQQAQTALLSNLTAASEKIHSRTLPRIFQHSTEIQSTKLLQLEWNKHPEMHLT